MNSDKRQEKIDKTLFFKQPTLQLFLENIHDSHNLSAIVRSCDAVGVLELYYTHPHNNHFRTHKTITQGAHRWVNRFKINEKDKCQFLKQKQAEGFQVIATHLDEHAVSFREVDYTLPTILIVGNEKEGVSKELIKIADKTIVIPMQGMVQSLNVSVATALVLYEAQRQRESKGMYESPQLSNRQREEIKKSWIYRDTVARRSRGKIHLEDLKPFLF